MEGKKNKQQNKLIIFFFMIVIILTLIMYFRTKYVYARYIMQKSVSIPIHTSDYYFDANADEQEITSFPAIIHITTKNNDGNNYTDTDLNYVVKSENPNYIVSVEGGNTRNMIGGSKQEENLVVTVNNSGNTSSENFELVFEINKPYVDKRKIIINIKTDDNYWSDEKGCNVPKLAENMTPIKWVNNVETETTKDDPEWYNYNEKQWANAKTNDGSYWVWIPRFAFQITSLYHEYNENTGGNINVRFLKNKENSAEGITIANANGLNNWNIPPAFNNFGGESVGFWVAKFEPSNNNGSIKVVPGVSSWANISVNDIFNTCLNYDIDLGSHMMKNSEWAAVVYLSQSQYGKGTADIKANSNNQNLTGGGSENAYITNISQSTTANVYGIYDMVGGTCEYMAAYVNNGNTKLNNGTSLVNADAKYKDVYEVGDPDNQLNNYMANANRYGEAIYDVSSTSDSSNNWQNAWYHDFSRFCSGSTPFIGRGGLSFQGNGAGLFCFIEVDGAEVSYGGFRPILTF